MTDLLTPTVEALLTRLAADGGLSALLGTPARVHDHRPAMASFPFLVVSLLDGRDTGAKGLQAQGLTVTVEVFSRQRGGQECRKIMAAVRECLHDAVFTITGGSLARCQEEFCAVRFDEGSNGSHASARYRLVVTG